jgi:hypothetical protein
MEILLVPTDFLFEEGNPAFSLTVLLVSEDVEGFFDD